MTHFRLPRAIVQDLGRRIPFAFLEDIKERYFAAFRSSCATAAAYTHNEEFAPVLQQRMAYFSNDRRVYFKGCHYCGLNV